MNKHKNLIPKLRFPDFKNDGEWKIEPLGNLSVEIIEKTKGRKFKLMSITSGVGLVSQIEKFGREIAGDSYKNYYVIRKGDFAYNRSSTKLYGEGEIALYENEEIGAVPNSIFTCFRFYYNKINPIFAKYPFINNLHGKWLKKFIAVGARANGALQVNIGDLFSLPFPYPSFVEQQKIAECLSSLDESIRLEKEKLDQLKDHKKGIIEALFPRVGERNPKYRFPDFVKKEKWQKRRLETLTSKIGDGLHSTPKYDDSGECYFINGNNLMDGKIQIDKKTKRVSEDEFKKYKQNLDYNTILLSINGTIGNLAFYNDEDVILGKSVCYINSNSEIDKNYLYFILKSPKLIAYFHSELTGSTIKNLSLKSIRDAEINFPLIKEQKQIASCLSALDDLITAQTEKIELLGQHKKGLMQGLFPKLID